MKQVVDEWERAIDTGLDWSKSSVLPVFAIAQVKLLKYAAAPHTSVLHLCLLFKEKFSCIDNKSDKYFHFFYSAFLFIIFLITFESCRVVVKFD